MAFMQRAHAVIPGAAGWLRRIYPLEAPTFVFDHDTVIESRASAVRKDTLMSALFMP